MHAEHKMATICHPNNLIANRLVTVHQLASYITSDILLTDIKLTDIAAGVFTIANPILI